MPTVSVIVPVYNGERYIQTALESILRQTYKDFEVVVVDDGSTDDSSLILKQMREPLVYVFQQNSGVAAARNRGFQYSSGKYIAFLDQDDVWYPNKLEVQVAILDADPTIGIIYGNLDLIDALGNIIEHYPIENPEEVHRETEFLDVFSEFPRPHPFPSSVVMRREIFDRSGMFDPEFRRNCHEDTELWFRLTKNRLGRFYFYPELVGQRRYHTLQGGQNQDAWNENWVLCLKKLLNLYNDGPQNKYLRWKLARIFSKKGEDLLATDDLERARVYLRESFDYFPFYRKNLGRIMRSYLRVG